MDFNPDEYLADKGFNPDEYLASKAPSVPAVAGNLQSPAWVDQFNKLYDAGRFDEAKALAGQHGQIPFSPKTDPLSINVGNVDPDSLAGKALAVNNWLSQKTKNIVGGAITGATNVAYGIPDYLSDKITGQNLESLVNPQTRHQKRMAEVLRFNQMIGAQPESSEYRAGEFGTELAGTGGAGKVVGGGLRAVEASPWLVKGIESGGFDTSAAKNLPQKIAAMLVGGGTNAAAQTAMTNPENANTAALIGAALPVAGKSIGAALKQTLGASTGVGPEAISQAYQAGKNGSSDFLDNLRGSTDFGDIVDRAKQGLNNIRQQRGDLYRSGMIDISNDKSIIPFDPIKNAMDDISGMGKYKGVDINKNASGTINDLRSRINEWAGLNPAEYHTPEGLDALKKSISDVRDATQPNTASRVAADKIYNAVKDQILNQAPVYSSVMKDYGDASKTLKETEQALSLGTKASEDTAVRKLQSLLRNNAHTNYGNRLNLAKNLEQNGGVDLMPSIAGQAMNSWMPRGMSGAIEKAGILPVGVAMATGHLPISALAAAPIASPRAVGELTYKVGQLAGSAGNTPYAQLLTKLLAPAVNSTSTQPNQQLINALLANQQGAQ